MKKNFKISPWEGWEVRCYKLPSMFGWLSGCINTWLWLKIIPIYCCCSCLYGKYDIHRKLTIKVNNPGNPIISYWLPEQQLYLTGNRCTQRLLRPLPRSPWGKGAHPPLPRVMQLYLLGSTPTFEWAQNWDAHVVLPSSYRGLGFRGKGCRHPCSHCGPFPCLPPSLHASPCPDSPYRYLALLESWPAI